MEWKYIITIECDTNDGDCISKTTEVDEETYNKYEIVFQKMITTPIPHHCGSGDCTCHNDDITEISEWLFENCEIFSDEEDTYDFQNMFFPCPVDDWGWHSIEEIEIKRIPANTPTEEIGHFKFDYWKEPIKKFIKK